jgi:hypothetical protein
MNSRFWTLVFAIALAGLLTQSASSIAAITIFGDAPRTELPGPGASFELGTVFQSSVAGEVTGLRFYMGPIEAGNPGGPIVGNLWTSGGTLLESATFNNPVQGWNEVNLLSPVPITAGTQYVVSANSNLTSAGTNASTNEVAFFASSSYTNGPLTATAGPYTSPDGAFPTYLAPNVGGGSFYGRDIVFQQATAALVPEPASMLIWLGAAGAILCGRRLTRSKKPAGA